MKIDMSSAANSRVLVVGNDKSKIESLISFYNLRDRAEELKFSILTKTVDECARPANLRGSKYSMVFMTEGDKSKINPHSLDEMRRSLIPGGKVVVL